MILELLKRVKAFEREAHNILSVHETSISRVILIEDTYKRLDALSIRQDELIRQALKCIEHKLFRAAHVMAWAGFMDFLEEKISSDGFKKLKGVRRNWIINTVEELREKVPEYQLIEATKDLKLCTKNEMKGLIGLLNRRNECAHPSTYFPGLNESLGYVSEILQRIENIQPKTL
ncbi:hypothetical protein CEE39_06110 [bacterium (candidate division B38) B3_B38]|nr:MAG: hypothetical protein CEE39_06110 [bacterium (candidate division B38) B3_B38]